MLFKTISELEENGNIKFNFIQKFKIKHAKNQIARQLHNEGLLEECDLITLKNGEEIKAVVTEVGTSEIKYKKCDNKTGPTFIMMKSDIFMIKYANGSKDFLGNQKSGNTNDVVNSDEAKTDGLAIASIVTGITGLVLGLLISTPAGIVLGLVGTVLGFISKNNIKNSQGRLKGKGLANTGIITGIIIMALSVLALILVL